MAEEKKAVPAVVEKEEEEYNSSLTFRDDVLAKIAAITAHDVDGIITMSGNFLSSVKEAFGQNNVTKGVTVDINGPGVTIDIELVMEFGQSAPQIFEQLKRNIGDKVRYMTGLELTGLNVRVVDIMTKQEYEAKKSGTPRLEEGKEDKEE